MSESVQVIIHRIERIERELEELKLELIELKKIMPPTLETLELTGEFAGYKLKAPIHLTVEYNREEDTWCVENPELELYGCGETLTKALRDAEEVFKALIEEYVLEGEDNLDEDARKLREALLRHVEVSP
ncbi:hypothetical protein FH039_07715 [Thermococcus indicus]|uniref:Uncharacterized protein n=2 Tax=Thermococcus TaxID=2263 RepID=A0A5C0SKV4_9EURY|nr:MULTISPECIES: hypothetical protein [Thermococcus]QDA31506.1 hypothetical protein FH039_07715 [Thermococcus indicus]QEK14044.1 hypothetical protein FPV09_01710 [Thermococcus aciditolerans]